MNTSKIQVDEDKSEVVLYLGQTDPQTGIFCRPGSLKIHRAHISKFRSAKISVENFIGLYDEELTLGALSSSTRKLVQFDRRTPEWVQAVRDHAERLISYQAFSKFEGRPPSKPGHSFFTGRVVDNVPKARLVANGALHYDQPIDSYLPLSYERFTFLSLAARRLKEGYKLYGGDISGAYYNTPGEGFLYLPHNWPEGVGGFGPRELVRLNCAIPGDTLSSGLFLRTLSELLVNNGFRRIVGATYTSSDDKICLIHFSDDVLVSCREDDLTRLQEVIGQRFSIDFQPVERWVSMEIECVEEGILISTTETANGMAGSSKAFKFSS